jgi:hypothetical protein
VQLRSLRHASTQEDDQTMRRKHAPAAGKRQIHARISRSESGRHALPCVYPLRTHFAHASPLAYCCPYACNQRMCHITCVVARVETQTYLSTGQLHLPFLLSSFIHFTHRIILLSFQHWILLPFARDNEMKESSRNQNDTIAFSEYVYKYIWQDVT